MQIYILTDLKKYRETDRQRHRDNDIRQTGREKDNRRTKWNRMKRTRPQLHAHTENIKLRSIQQCLSADSTKTARNKLILKTESRID